MTRVRWYLKPKKKAGEEGPEPEPSKAKTNCKNLH